MRDVSTTGGYVPFSIYKYMKINHLYVIKIIILRIIFIKIFTGVLNLRIFNNVLKMGDINHAN